MMENKPNTASEKKTFAVTNGIGIVGNSVTFVPPSPIFQLNESEIKSLRSLIQKNESDLGEFKTTTPSLIRSQIAAQEQATDKKINDLDNRFVQNAGGVEKIRVLTELQYNNIQKSDSTIYVII